MLYSKREPNAGGLGITLRRTQPICIKWKGELAQTCQDNDSAGAVVCCASCVGYAHVARFTGRQQKGEERGPRLEEDMEVGTKRRRGARGGPTVSAAAAEKRWQEEGDNRSGGRRQKSVAVVGSLLKLKVATVYQIATPQGRRGLI